MLEKRIKTPKREAAIPPPLQGKTRPCARLLSRADASASTLKHRVSLEPLKRRATQNTVDSVLSSQRTWHQHALLTHTRNGGASSGGRVSNPLANSNPTKARGRRADSSGESAARCVASRSDSRARCGIAVAAPPKAHLVQRSARREGASSERERERGREAFRAVKAMRDAAGRRREQRGVRQESGGAQRDLQPTFGSIFERVIFASPREYLEVSSFQTLRFGKRSRVL